MVRVEAPVAAPTPFVKVRVVEPLPGAANVGALKEAVTFAGTPEIENATCWLKPATTAVVNLTVPAVLLAVTLDALDVKVNPGTFTVSFLVCVTPPPLALIVTAYAFGTVLASAAKVTVVVADPGAEIVLDGANCTVSPAGNTVLPNVTAELKVEFAVVVTVI